MRRFATLLSLAAVVAAACHPQDTGAREPQPKVDVALAGETMGSTWNVKIALPEQRRDDALRAQVKIEATLERINDEMSTYRPNSELSRFNRQQTTSPVALSPELARVMERALQVGKESGGAYDVTIDPLIDLWGFDRSGRKVELPTSVQVAAAMRHTGLAKLAFDGTHLTKLDPEVAINLGGIAAGFAADVVCQELAAAGFTDYMVEITGEVCARGNNAGGQPWRIGIKVPDITADSHDVLAAVSLMNKAVTTSGSYHNFFVGPDGKRYSHVIDPRTGAPVQTDLVSVTVLSDDALTADAFDTAFVILGEERARAIVKRHPGMSAFFVRQSADGALTTSMTEGFPILLGGSTAQQEAP